MVSWTRNMNQMATYWAPGIPDGFGGMTMQVPVTVTCRWQEQAVLFRDAEGREVTSSVVVYPVQELIIRGYLALGDQTVVLDPRDLATAFEIRQVQQSPSLDATQVLHKVYL